MLKFNQDVRGRELKRWFILRSGLACFSGEQAGYHGCDSMWKWAFSCPTVSLSCLCVLLPFLQAMMLLRGPHQRQPQDLGLSRLMNSESNKFLLCISYPVYIILLEKEKCIKKKDLQTLKSLINRSDRTEAKRKRYQVVVHTDFTCLTFLNEVDKKKSWVWNQVSLNVVWVLPTVTNEHFP